MFELFMFWVWVSVLSYLAIAVYAIFILFGARLLIAGQLKQTNLNGVVANKIGDGIYALCNKIAFGRLWDQHMAYLNCQSLHGMWIGSAIFAGCFHVGALVYSFENNMTFGATEILFVTTASTHLATYTSWAAPLVLIVVTAKVVFVKAVNFWVKISATVDKINKASE